MENRNEWVIHVWGKKRDNLELTHIEKFHLDMIDMFRDQQMRFDRILVNIAMDDLNDKKLFNYLKSQIKKHIVNPNLEFKSCQNDSTKGEYVTFRPYVFDRIGQPVNVFYSHFKGYSSYLYVAKESYPKRIISMCEMFWSYIMYRYSMNFDEVQEKLDNGMSIYAWFILHSRIDKVDKTFYAYYTKYQQNLQKGNPKFNELIEGERCKHSPGSFVWYNLKAIGESLKDKPEITSITTEYLIENSTADNTLCTHFCELYLMQYLKDDECYSVNDYNDVWCELKNTIYTAIYPSKKVARELIGDFEKYLIENKLM